MGFDRNTATTVGDAMATNTITPTTVAAASLSNPCPERCPLCHRRCFGAVGHTRIATAGKGYAGAHQCQCGMMWASACEWVDIMRAESRATRKECAEAVKGCHKCREAIRRLGT